MKGKYPEVETKQNKQRCPYLRFSLRWMYHALSNTFLVGPQTDHLRQHTVCTKRVLGLLGNVSWGVDRSETWLMNPMSRTPNHNEVCYTQSKIYISLLMLPRAIYQEIPRKFKIV